MGFSFNEIDMPYIKAILSSNSNKYDIDWTIYYHQEGEDDTIIEKLQNIDIKKKQINKSVCW